MSSLLRAIREWWTGCYESEPIVLGQPWGANTTVHCKCDRLLSTRREDWTPVEETRQFETVCPECGPVRVGHWGNQP